MGFIGFVASLDLWPVRMSLEQLVLDLLGDRELFGLDIMRLSGGRISRIGLYILLSDMAGRGVTIGRDINKGNTLSTFRRICLTRNAI